MVYQRSKNILAARPMGTVLNVYQEEHNWFNHSMAPTHIDDKDFRCRVGEGDKAYDANISGTPFGAMSPPAIQSMSNGVHLGGFAHNTGEGSFPPTIRQAAEILSGKFQRAILAVVPKTENSARTQSLKFFEAAACCSDRFSWQINVFPQAV